MRPQLLPVLVLLVTASADAQRAMPSHAPTRPAPVPVARINGATLTSDRVELQLQGLIPTSSFHRNVKPERMAELRAQALDLAIDEELQYQEAVRLHVVVTAAEVEAGLERARRRYPSPAAFESARQNAGVSIKELRANLRRAMMVEKVRKRAVLATCTVSAAEARQFYTKNPQRFVTPERLHIHVITVGVDPSSSREMWENARLKAERLLKEIQDGARFEDVARRESTDEARASGGDLGIVHRGRLNEEFESAVQSLRPGQMTPVIRSLRGFHLLRLTEILPPVAKSYAEVRKQLLKDLTEKRCEDREQEWRTSLRARATIELVPTTSAAARP